ncbi:MAG: tetratricopeptide repeat protein [Pyrinomonadaceae bacterium]
MKVLGRLVYRFEGIELFPAQGRLRRDGEESYPRQKSFQLLLYLIEQRHRLVTKDELIERVWADTAVTDDALVQLIGELRRGLGDDPRRPRFIKTIPKAGYRFIAPVEELFSDLPATFELEEHASFEIEYEEEISDETAPGEACVADRLPSSRPRLRTSLRRPLLVAVAVASIVAPALAVYLLTRPQRRPEPTAEVTLPQVAGAKTLAVMYFDNRSASPELDWLREGLADMLITDFSRSPSLTVLSRGQLQLLLARGGHEPGTQLRLDEALDIARRTHAEVLAVGSFARLDEKVRIEVQLHDTRTGSLLAAESLTADRPGRILDEIDLLSLKLAAHLGAAPAEQAGRRGLAEVMTDNLEAYRYYSLALEKAQGLQNVEAITLLEKAVALDPQFAMAHARIGYAYAITWNYPEKAKRHFERAFQLSDHLTEKDRLYITGWYAIANKDFARAAVTFRLLVANYPFEVEAYLRLGRLLQGEEREEEAISVLRQGLTTDPDAPDLYNVLGGIYSNLGQHDEAVRMHQRYVELAPDEPNAHDSLGMSYQWAGRYDEALSEYERALALKPEFEVAVIHLANTYYAMGRYREAVEQYERYIRLAKFGEERVRGYHSLAYLYLKKQDLRRAERMTRQTSQDEQQRFWAELPLVLERGTETTVEQMKSRFPAMSLNMDRGAAATPRNFYYWRGALSFRLGHTQEAVDDFREALRHQPPKWQLATYEDCLADAYLELGRLDEAIGEYERILLLNPNYPLAHYHLGQAFEQKGLPEQARDSYERFLQIWQGADDDLPEVLAAREYLAGHQWPVQ